MMIDPIQQLIELSDGSSLEEVNINKQLFDQLVDRISIMLDQEPNYLFSMLYRLDVREDLLKKAINQEEPAKEIANLIIKRQIQRIETKKKYS